MTKLFKPFFSLIRLFNRTGNLSAAYKLLPEVFSPHIHSKVSAKNGLYFKEFNKTITQKQLSLFGRHGEVLLNFVKSPDVHFLPASNGQEIVAIQINGAVLKMKIKSFDNLKVIEELFINRLYDFIPQDKYVVIDVGMNTGAACLYFASFQNVDAVWGYEPFIETFNSANDNLQINEDVIRAKVRTFNSGVGAVTTSLDVPKPEDGSLGGSTSDFFIQEAGINEQDKITVNIEGIVDVIQKIKAKYPRHKLILKLDCEGAEYEILEAMHTNSLINKVDLYMIEYHFKGAYPIKNIFAQYPFHVSAAGYAEFSPNGMLYTVNLS